MNQPESDESAPGRRGQGVRSHAADAFVAVRAWGRRRRRGLRACAWALAALWGLYLLAANVFLNTEVGERVVNRKPERFHAEWRWAASLYPGHVHVRDVRMRGRSRATGWEAEATRATGRIQVLPLLRRQVRIGTVHAEDVALATDRSRRSEEDAAPPAAGAAPRRSPWRLRMDEIRTGTLRRLQFDDWRFEGGGEAAFGFSKVFGGGALEIFPSRLDMRRASVRYGELRVFGNGPLRFDLALPPHRPQEAPGRRKLGIADARLQAHGEVPGLALVEGEDGRIGWRMDAEPGRLDADLALVRGELQPGGSVRLQTRLSTAGDDAAPAQRPLRVDAEIAEGGVEVRARMPRQADRPGFVEARLRSAQRRLDAESALDWVRTLSGRVALAWRFGSLRWINPLLPAEGWLRLQGVADVEADLQLEAGRLAPGSTARIRDAELRAQVFDSVFSGQARVDARVEGDDAARRTRVEILAERFAVAALREPDAQYLRGRDLRLDLEADGDLAAFRRSLQAHLRFQDAQIPDLRVYNRYLPGDSLRLLSGSGTLGGDLRIDPQGEVVRGDIDLRGRGAGIRVGASELHGNLSVAGAMRREREGRRDYRLQPLRLQLRQVRLAGADDAPWWADVDLSGARLTWREPFAVDSDVRLRMKDASLLLSLFAERTAFPRWIGRIVDAGEVEATARTRVRGGELIVDGLEARNDRVDLQARLRVADGTPQGDLYARWGVLGVGAELQGGERRLHTLGAREWYRARPPLLPR